MADPPSGTVTLLFSDGQAAEVFERKGNLVSLDRVHRLARKLAPA
jgi:hypothetical protein